jgi:TolB-like protein
MFHKIIFLLFFFAVTLLAQGKEYVAVMEVVPGQGVPLSPDETAYIADEMRNRARAVLPDQEFIVMTRENIFSLLPPGKTIDECAEGQCAVEVGRLLGAEYITDATVRSVGGMLAINIQLYATRTGNLVAGANSRQKDVAGLLAFVAEEMPKLFGKLSGEEKKQKEIAIDTVANTIASLPANDSNVASINEDASKKFSDMPTLIPKICFFVTLGVAFLVGFL